MSRAGGGEDLLAAIDREVEHAAGVLADGVVDLGRRDAVAVLQHRVERDPVVLLGQVLGADADRHAVADAGRGRRRGGPRPRARRPLASALTASVPMPMARLNWKLIAAHEAARAVGLVELLAPQAERRAAMPVHRFVDIAVTSAQGWNIRFLPDQPAGIGQPVGEAAGGRVQQQPRRADAVAGEDDDFGRLELLDAVGVVVDHAVAMPSSPVVISRTRQLVRSSTPARMACGQ